MINTENNKQTSTFEDAILHSLPSLNGLWFPKKINKLPNDFFNHIEKLSVHEIAFQVFKNFCDFKLNDEKLKKVISKAFNFPIKLNNLTNTIHILETFHGPTYTFKDFGARFLSCYLQELLSDTTKQYNILVSTSGDTGSAIASAFYNARNIKVTILYPKGRVSDIQELQMTTYGKNIIAYSIENNFDECQTLVKKAFIDKDIQSYLISANSINIGRLLPQTVYYFVAYSILKKQLGNKIVNNCIFSVPCGNCGNLTGGLIANRMGLNVKFIASQNKNNVFVDYLQTGVYTKRVSEKTYSNAMDVGDPSNVKRINHLYNNNVESIKKDIKTVTCDEKTTLECIQKVWKDYYCIIDPHTAVAFKGVIQNQIPNKYYIIVSTAAPFKFRDVIQTAIGITPQLPKPITKLLEKPKCCLQLSKKNYLHFKLNLLKMKQSACSITFIGMPGTGKSVTSFDIHSKNNNFKLIELDELISEMNQDDDLFTLLQKYGEDGFKKLEEEAILSIDFTTDKKVISTGGSVIYSESGMSHLQNEQNLIVYLQTPFEILQQRTENFTNRGIVFNGLTPYELFLERHKLYCKYSDIIVDTKGLSINTISEMILEFLK